MDSTNKGPNQPQHPGHRRRRRRRGAPGKKQHAGQQPSHNGSTPGGAGGGGGQQRRQNRGRRTGPAFVGPMDHSYRNGQGQNGNVSDVGNRNGSAAGRFTPQDVSPVSSAASGPARIFCFVDDLFFVAKIQETAKKLNVKVEFVKSVEPIMERADETVPEGERPNLIVFDLNNLGVKPLSLIPKLRSQLKKSASIIGFVSHLQGDLKMKAQEAGCDMVMPRSAFSQNLPQLLRRHGMPEDLHEALD